MEKFLENKPNSRKGLFITFEGGEGAGKTTQINLLKSFLKKKNFNVVTTREPGGTPEGERVRKFLVSGKINSWDAYSEALIFNAIRREHINKVIKPAINNGLIVLCDRYVDSTIVYQGIAGNVEQKFLLELHSKYCYNLYPHLTFFLNLSPFKGMERVKKRVDQTENRFENLGLYYHTKVYEGFLKLHKESPKRIINIDADLNENLVAKSIYSHISKLII